MQDPQKRKRLGVTIPQHLYNELKADAARKGITLTRYILQVIITHMKYNGMDTTPPKPE